MKNQRLIGFSFASALSLMTLGCNKDEFLDVNTDPNNPSVVAPGTVLSAVEVSTGFNMGNDVNRATSILVQHYAGIGNQVADFDAFRLALVGFDDTWNRFYSSSIFNANQLITLGSASSSPAYTGIAKLIKAYNFAVVTDLWGDVPYSQAALGQLNFQPRFDRQEDIYKGTADIQSLFDLVREGLRDLDQTSVVVPAATEDPIYAGNLVKWRKMGNTLLLKLALTISKKEPALARTVINEVLSKSGTSYIASNADDFQVPFGSASGSQNPIYSFNFVARTTDQFMSQRLLDSMRVKNDPRLPFFFTATPTVGTTSPSNTSGTATTLPGPGGVGFLTFTGYQNGSGAGAPVVANRSLPGVYQVGPTGGDAPIRLITNFQRAFILAEASLNLGVTVAGATAQQLYTEGITQSMLKAGLTQAQITAYLAANPDVATLSGSDTRKTNQIITQKWIAWVGNGYEPYNDYRRTGFPRLVLPQNTGGDDPTAIPARFPYPNQEITSNPNSLGTVKTNVPVWWATK
jgi:hypothetical protein